MELIPLNYKNVLLQNPFLGFALHKIVTDKSGQPIDFEYLEVNKQFEKYTGLKASEIIGKRITEIVPGFEKEGYSWIKFFGNVALSGKSDEIEQYSENFKKWYSVQALCPAKGYFIALFYDITRIKNSENKLKKINEEYATLNEEYLSQNEELQSSLEESNDKTTQIGQALHEVEQSKKELQRKEVLQESILNSTENGLLAVNNEGEVIFANKRFYEMWNIPDKVKDKSDDRELIKCILKQLADPEGFIKRVEQLYSSNEITTDLIYFNDDRTFERYSEALVEDNKIIGRTWSFFDTTEKENQKNLLKKTNKILNGIRKINSLQSVASDSLKFINDVCFNLVHVFGFEGAMINLFENKTYVAGAHENYEEQFKSLQSNFKNGEEVPCIHKAAQSKRLVIVDNPLTQCEKCPNYQQSNDNGCTFVVPIKTRKKIFGYLNIKESKENSYDDKFLNLLKEIGNEIAVALLNLELEKKQEEHITQIELRENKLNSILQSSPIGIAYVKNRIFYTVNDKFCKITGYSVSELAGEKARKLYADDKDYKEVGRLFKKLENGYNSELIEVKWKRKNGEDVDILLSVAIVNPLNPKDGYSVTIEDITVQKQDKLIKSILLNISKESNKTDNTEHLAPTIRAELGRLFDTENFYIALYEAEKDMYSFPYHIDKFENEYVASDHFYNLSGSLTDLVRKEKRALLIDEKQEEELINSGKIEQIGVKSPLWMAAPFLDSNNNSFGVIAIQHYEDENAYNKEDLEILDNVANYLGKIYDKKQAEKKLKESEEQYRVLIENQGEGVVHVDLKENVLFINPAGAKIFGLEINQILGKNLSEFFDEEQFDIIKNETLKRIEGETSSYELIVKNKKGYKITILLTATPLYKNSKVIGNLGIFRDITDRKRAEIILRQKNEELQAAEEELRASNDELHTVNTELEESNKELLIAKEKAESADKLKSAFLANMSHEIRTPMNSILGFSELLKNNNLPTEKQKHFIDIINANGTQLISIIDDIIDFSKIEANQLELHYSKVDLIQNCEEIFYTYKKRAQVENPDIKLNLEMPLVKEFIIETDIVRLKQVISNLVGNALKFTEIGEVTLGFKQSNQELTFFIKDTGIGIAPDKLDVIFERFRQADDSRSREFGGTGLGLTISKRIIDLLGGKMWVESIIDEGSQFYFTIPLL